MTRLTSDLLQRLAVTDTPTVCNAIELAQGKRGFNQFTRGGRYVVMHNTSQVAFGYARTASIAAEHETTRSNIENRQVRMDYYRYMSEGPRPAVCVIEDKDSEPVGAFWGEVNTSIHRGFGISGTLTNGAIRDFGNCPGDYQVIGGAVSPSHRFVHVCDIGQPVTLFGLAVAEGDFVHADRNGGCIVPPDILPQLEYWIDKMQALEGIVIQPARSAEFSFDTFARAWSSLENKRV